MNGLRRLCLAVIAIVLWSSSGSVAEAEPPIRIGASASKTGAYAAVGQNQLRGYELCVQHTNERGGSSDGSSSWSLKTISLSPRPPSASTSGSSHKTRSSSSWARTARP